MMSPVHFALQKTALNDNLGIREVSNFGPLSERRVSFSRPFCPERVDSNSMISPLSDAPDESSSNLANLPGAVQTSCRIHWSVVHTFLFPYSTKRTWLDRLVESPIFKNMPSDSEYIFLLLKIAFEFLDTVLLL